MNIKKTMPSHRSDAQAKILAMYLMERSEDPVSKEPLMKVLVADDNLTFRSTLKRVMETRGGFQVWEARDGEEAVELARALQPDLILIDLSMPRMDGLEAVRLIRARDPSVRIIVCSIFQEPIYRRAARVSGADAFLPKSRCYSEMDWIRKFAEGRGKESEENIA